jgi:hypothetical protein
MSKVQYLQLSEMVDTSTGFLFTLVAAMASQIAGVKAEVKKKLVRERALHREWREIMRQEEAKHGSGCQDGCSTCAKR